MQRLTTNRQLPMGGMLRLIALMAVVSLVLAGCSDVDPTPTDSARQAFLDDPEAFVGEHVVVTSEVDELFGAGVLTIQATERSILVISASQWRGGAVRSYRAESQYWLAASR
jgi:hypothetical protein